MSSYRRTRSRARAEAPQPRNNPGTTEITEFDKLSLPIPRDEDDSDHALNLLKELDKLKVIDARLLVDLEEATIILILKKLRLDSNGGKKTLVKKLKEVMYFPLSSFDKKSVAELSGGDVNANQLAIYYLHVTGCLLADGKNMKKSELAGKIVQARELDFYKNLSCEQIKDKVEETIGKYYKDTRKVERMTLVNHLQQTMGEYKDESNGWIRNEATEIQLRVELQRLAPNLGIGHAMTRTRENLQEEIIRLRQQRSPPPPANSTFEEKGRDPTPTKDQASRHASVPSGDSNGRGGDPPADSHPSTTPKPKHGVNAKQSQRNEEEELRGVADEERDIDEEINTGSPDTLTGGVPTAAAALPSLNGSSVSTVVPGSTGAVVVPQTPRNLQRGEDDDDNVAPPPDQTDKRMHQYFEKLSLRSLQHDEEMRQMALQHDEESKQRTLQSKKQDELIAQGRTQTDKLTELLANQQEVQKQQGEVQKQQGEVQKQQQRQIGSLQDEQKQQGEVQKQQGGVQKQQGRVLERTVKKVKKTEKNMKKIAEHFGVNLFLGSPDSSSSGTEDLFTPPAPGEVVASGGVAQDPSVAAAMMQHQGLEEAIAPKKSGEQLIFDSPSSKSIQHQSTFIGSVEFADANKAISATEAKEVVLQDALSASDEQDFLESIANVLLDENSTEVELLEALDNLERALRFGREHETNKYADFVYDFNGLTDRLAQMQYDVSDNAYHKIKMIMENYLHGEMDDDSDATQDDGEGQTSELREAKVFRSENGRWKYCLGSYEYKNSENELVTSRIVGKLIIDNNKLTVRHTSNRSPLFCATVGEGFTYTESSNGVPMVYAQELGSKPTMYLIDVEENDRNDLKEALKKLSGA